MNQITRINLTNLKKCNQVWVDMPETEQGRICQKCSHTIIDFRKKTDTEIARAHAFSDQTVCGLYKPEQIKLPQQKTNGFFRNKWNAIYLGLFSLLSLQTYGQEISKSDKIEQTDIKSNPQTDQREILTNRDHRKKQIIDKNIAVRDSIIITGKITNPQGEPLPFASVIVQGEEIGTSADFDGLYKLVLSNSIVENNSLTLSFKFIGYSDQSIIVDPNKLLQNDTIVIDNQFKSETQIIAYTVSYRAPIHKRIWRKTRGLFRRRI